MLCDAVFKLVCFFVCFLSSKSKLDMHDASSRKHGSV